jgi:hypothetical protein
MSRPASSSRAIRTSRAISPEPGVGGKESQRDHEHLVTRGVDGDRITIVSYGDRRPVCREPQETCWAQNRRAVVGGLLDVVVATQ